MCSSIRSAALTSQSRIGDSQYPRPLAPQLSPFSEFMYRAPFSKKYGIVRAK
jgi:hypothetical protein